MVIAAVDISPSVYGSRNGITVSSTVLGNIETSMATEPPAVATEIVDDAWKTTTVLASDSALQLTTANAMSTLMKRLRMKRTAVVSVDTDLVQEPQQGNANMTNEEFTSPSMLYERMLITKQNHQSTEDDSVPVRTTMTNTNRIAFGSCNEQSMKNHLWNVIEARKPNAYIWGGDAIYADHNVPNHEKKELDGNKCASPERIQQLYAKQLNNVGYKSLLEQNITVFGTVDDHDFGCDNGDSTNIYRKESGIAFVDFIGLPIDSLTRIRAEQGLGVYGVKLFDFGIASDGKSTTRYDIPDAVAGIDADIVLDDTISNDEMKYSNRSVAVFVLDVRSNKSPWKQDIIGRLSADMDGDFLGKDQWDWFTKSLRRSKASVNIIVGGLQFHGTRAPDVNIAEAWGNYPRMQQKLYDLLLEENVQSPILISGDVHMTQLSRKDCVQRRTNNAKGKLRRNRRSLIELTTSGMTHSWGTLSEKYNEDDTDLQDQVSTSWQPLQLFRNGLNWARMKAVATYVHSLHRFCPWTDIVVAGNSNKILDVLHPWNSMNELSVTDSTGTGATMTTVSSSRLYENGGGESSVAQQMQYSLEMNFGELEFDWIHRTVAIRSIGHDNRKDDTVGSSDGELPLIMARYSMDQLSGLDELSNHYTKLESDFILEENYQRNSDIEGEWVCINHRGRATNAEHFVGHVAAGSVLIALFLSPICLSILVLYIVRRKMISSTTTYKKLVSIVR